MTSAGSCPNIRQRASASSPSQRYSFYDEDEEEEDEDPFNVWPWIDDDAESPPFLARAMFTIAMIIASVAATFAVASARHRKSEFSGRKAPVSTPRVGNGRTGTTLMQGATGPAFSNREQNYPAKAIDALKTTDNSVPKELLAKFVNTQDLLLNLPTDRPRNKKSNSTTKAVHFTLTNSSVQGIYPTQPPEFLRNAFPNR